MFSFGTKSCIGHQMSNCQMSNCIFHTDFFPCCPKRSATRHLRTRTMSFSATFSPRNKTCGAWGVWKAKCELLSDHNIDSSCLMEQFGLNVLTWSHIAFLERCHNDCTHVHVSINTHENQSPVSQQEVLFPLETCQCAVYCSIFHHNITYTFSRNGVV